MPYADPSNESLSDSLMERFDNMETDETLPERQIVPVTVIKDKNGRLGLKVTGVPSGIYVEDFNVKFVMKRDDKCFFVHFPCLKSNFRSNYVERFFEMYPNIFCCQH